MKCALINLIRSLKLAFFQYIFLDKKVIDVEFKCFQLSATLIEFDHVHETIVVLSSASKY